MGGVFVVSRLRTGISYISSFSRAGGFSFLLAAEQNYGSLNCDRSPTTDRGHLLAAAAARLTARPVVAQLLTEIQLVLLSVLLAQLVLSPG
jgi:hypothetical protein